MDYNNENQPGAEGGYGTNPDTANRPEGEPVVVSEQPANPVEPAPRRTDGHSLGRFRLWGSHPTPKTWGRWENRYGTTAAAGVRFTSSLTRRTAVREISLAAGAEHSAKLYAGRPANLFSKRPAE